MAAVDQLQVIADPKRRQILALVWDREMAAGEIADRFDISFGAVSQHLAILREAGFVHRRRDGNHRYYRTDKEGLGPLRPVLETMWRDTLDDLAEAVERESHGEAG